MKSFRFAAILPALLVLCSFRYDNRADYPCPAGKKNMLFYLQRSLNKNTIVYELNTNERNEVNVRQPVKMYWINYSGKGDEENLNFIQNKYAYGLEFTLLDAVKQSYSFNFVSYRKQTLFLLRNDHTHRFEVFTTFGQKLIRVSRIYVHIEGGSFWFPAVKYVLVSGVNHHTGEELHEKIIP